MPVNPGWYYTNPVGYIISFLSTGSMAVRGADLGSCVSLRAGRFGTD